MTSYPSGSYGAECERLVADLAPPIAEVKATIYATWAGRLLWRIARVLAWSARG